MMNMEWVEYHIPATSMDDSFLGKSLVKHCFAIGSYRYPPESQLPITYVYSVYSLYLDTKVDTYAILTSNRFMEIISSPKDLWNRIVIIMCFLFIVIVIITIITIVVVIIFVILILILIIIITITATPHTKVEYIN